MCQFDEEIRHHLSQVRELRSQLNTRAGINQLPISILQRIFIFTRMAYEAQSSYSACPFSGFPNELRWILVTHVNQHWRTIGLSISTLWLNPPLFRPKLAGLLLERSKNSAISVKLDFSDAKSDFLQTVLQHVERMEALHITHATARNFQEGLSKIPTRAPNLEKLSIHSHQSNPPSLPSTIFRDAINLRYLELSGIQLDWDSHLFNSLHGLSLTCMQLACRRPRIRL